MLSFNIVCDLARLHPVRLAVTTISLLLVCSLTTAQTPNVAAAFARAELGDLKPLQVATKKPLTDADRALVEARLAIARLDQGSTASALDRYAKLEDADQERLRLYYTMRSELALLRSDYRAAADAGVRWEQLPGSKEQADYAAFHQATAMMGLLRDAKPETIGKVSRGEIAYERDKVGLMRSDISIDSHPQQAVIDTGASFSVLNASTAKRLNLRMLGEISVGSSVQQSVRSQVAVAGHVVVGGTSFENVVFLVLEDDQLAYPSIDYRIDAILGFPELHRLGRLHITQDNIRVEPQDPYRESESNLVFAGTQSFVKVEVNGLCVPLHVDTGANSSGLTYLFQKDHPKEVAALPAEKRQVGGAGGMTEVKVLNWQGVHIKIGNRVAPPVDLDIDTAEHVLDPQRLGTLGRDVLNAAYSIDFGAMQISIDGGTLEPTRACASD